MIERDYLKDNDELMNSIKKGAFLTVKSDEELNTMTIGWASLGFIWQRKIFMVAVRDSRHTFKLIEKTDSFTVTIPQGEKYSDALNFCGTKSGRDFNKFTECDLNTKDAIHVASPIIDIPGIHYECKIVCKTAMNPDFMINEFDKFYPQKDYHTLYFGEILACYKTE